MNWRGKTALIMGITLAMMVGLDLVMDHAHTASTVQLFSFAIGYFGAVLVMVVTVVVEDKEEGK